MKATCFRSRGSLEAKVRFDDFEIKRQQDLLDPFPIYPFETLHQDVKSIVYLKDNDDLILTTLKPFLDKRSKEEERFADDEYLFKGPGTDEPSIKNCIEGVIVQNK
jgi:hypothetical protein